MTVNATSSIDSAGALASAAAPAGSNVDGEQRFLKLLVTQLNNQDPLNPLQNAELTSQLAQMSTVSGIEKLNSALQSLISQSGSGQVLQAASLIGRTVLVPDNALFLRDGAATPFGIETGAAADSVTVTIIDASGATIRTLDLGAQPSGLKTLVWDGKTDRGTTAVPGDYQISVVAKAGDAHVAASTLAYSEVSSVAQGAHGVSVELGAGKSATLGNVRLIL